MILTYFAWTRRLLAWPGAFGQWSNLWVQMPGAVGGRWQGWTKSSRNQAFDDYRAERFCNLEEGQGEFQAYLNQLRRARDTAEFDKFMAERRKQPGTGQSTALEQGNPPATA